uniref:RCC1-like domain-containing protein n=1 Tax=Hanusia phi TaxID=3032 RepID=A0A7S0E4A4_9CRYP
MSCAEQTCGKHRKVVISVSAAAIFCSMGASVAVAESSADDVSGKESEKKHTLSQMVFSWGGGLSGALGIGETRNSVTPKHVETLPMDVTQVDCGDSWSACIAGGSLYTWGKGQDGRLGLGEVLDVLYPQRVNLQGVKSVSAGHRHAAAIVGGGQVFVWGRGFSGQLGLGSNKSHFTPQPLPFSMPVKTLSCGGSHSLFVTEDGRLFATGRGKEGQLGTGSQESVLEPVEVRLPEEAARVTATACGKDFSVIATESGQVYTFGSDDYGQLGLGQFARYAMTPKEVAVLSGKKVRSVAAGDYHAAAVTADGKLYTWGYGRSGQLGNGNTVDVSLPVLVRELQNLRVQSVACGCDHTVAVLESGEVFVMGRGREGQLGRGDIVESPVAYRSAPLQVTSFAHDRIRVHQVACGTSHTLARGARS